MLVGEGGVNVSLVYLLRSPPVLTSRKLFLLPGTILSSLSVVVANTGPFMARIGE
jgi:hypothetical protein